MLTPHEEMHVLLVSIINLVALLTGILSEIRAISLADPDREPTTVADRLSLRRLRDWYTPTGFRYHLVSMVCFLFVGIKGVLDLFS